MHWVRLMKRSASEQSRSKVVPKLKFLARLVRKKGETVPNTKFVVLGSSHEKFGVSTSPLNPEIKRHNRNAGQQSPPLIVCGGGGFRTVVLQDFCRSQSFYSRCLHVK